MSLTNQSCGPEPSPAYYPNSGLHTVEWLQWKACNAQSLIQPSQGYVDRHLDTIGTFPTYEPPSTMSQILGDPTLTAMIIMGLIFVAAILVIAVVFVNSRKDTR